MTGQTAFRAALLDPSRAAPVGLTGPDGGPAGKRFDVYRNNVTMALGEALEVAFPVLLKLLGEDFFRPMARAFLRAHPPESPVLMFYGAAMPGFLESFPPAQDWQYLPDIARLELALRQSYHAADAPPLDPQALALPPERLMAARIGIAPAVRVLASDWPVHAIWRANTQADAPAPAMRPEELLIGRPGLDPGVWLLPPGGAGFVTALAGGRTLGVALEEAGETFDLGAALQVLLTAGALTTITEGTENAATDRAP
jgi:hypothetical protein